MIGGTTLCVAAYYTVRNYLMPDGRWLDSIVLIVFYLIYMLEYIIAFRISFPKLLYIFMVVQAYSNIINVTAKYIDVKLFPGDVNVMAAVPYSCMILGMMLVTLPFL